MVMTLLGPRQGMPCPPSLPSIFFFFKDTENASLKNLNWSPWYHEVKAHTSLRDVSLTLFSEALALSHTHTMVGR